MGSGSASSSRLAASQFDAPFVTVAFCLTACDLRAKEREREDGGRMREREEVERTLAP